MYKEIMDKFLEAEKEGDDKVREVYNKILKEANKNIKILANLSLVIDYRYDSLLTADSFSQVYNDIGVDLNLYVEKNLNEEEYYKFGELANKKCIKDIEL